MPRVLILGAGITGLTVAFRLQQARPDVDITILEPRQRPGGTIWTEQQNGFRVEMGPNGFLDNKPSTIQLCRDLGLGDRLVAASEAAGKNRYLLVDGRLKALPGSLLSFLTSDLLSWRGKASLVMERFRKPRLDATDESVHAFAVRRVGREAAEVFADAMVTGIQAGDPRMLSVAAAFPRLAMLEREYGSVIKGFGRVAKQRRSEAKARGEPAPPPGRMWSFRDGLKLLVEALCGQLKTRPHFGVQVRRVLLLPKQDGQSWSASASKEESWQADAAVLACPAYQQAALLADLDTELADKIGGIPYNSVAVVALGYRRGDVPRPLDGFGYIAPQRTRRDVLGVQWCSSIFPGRAPDDAVLLRAICGGWNRPEISLWDDERLLGAVRGDLNSTMGIRATPIMQQIVRWNRAIPQYVLGHLDRVAWIEKRAQRYPGLFLTGNAYHGVALNDCTEQGAEVAQRAAQYLSRSPTTVT